MGYPTALSDLINYFRMDAQKIRIIYVHIADFE